MKKLIPLYFFTRLLSIIWLLEIGWAYGQPALVYMWDKRFGGITFDRIYSFQQTADKGFILGGTSGSGIGGDKTQNSKGGNDYWIVKIDSIGTKQWDKDFGGTSNDYLLSVQQTSDGGYILGGRSESDAGGDKTEPLRGTFGNDADYWIVKVDSLGIKQWDKDFGGTSGDWLYCIKQAPDGGYILGGYSVSGIGGDKTEASKGQSDFWIVKTDSLGNKQWDRDFGGNGSEELYSLDVTQDDGFIVGGFSSSGINGDKTQSSRGGLDYWIIKTDSAGNKQWDRDFGGSNAERMTSIEQTADKGYILGGWSMSSTGGDKTQPNFGGQDYWVLKIDSAGNKEWDKDFGGNTDEPVFGDVTQTIDGGFAIAGTSRSDISGNKSENNLGQEQTWVIKTDYLGNKQWDNTIFTLGLNQQGLIIQTDDLCYAIVNYASGDIGGYKTQISRGGYDYWIAKFKDTLLIADFNSYRNICIGSCIDFENHSLNAISYQWYFPGALIDTSTAYNPTGICYNSLGNYDVRLIATSPYRNDTLLLPGYITVHPPAPPSFITITTCDTYSIPGGHYVWDVSGTYVDTILNENRCDSIITVNLTINNQSNSTIDTVSCIYTSPSGNNTWSESGTYLDTIYNASGCDSIITINLSSATSSDIYIVECNEYVSPSGSQVWTSDGVYHDTIPNQFGCDSLITVHLSLQKTFAIRTYFFCDTTFTSPSGNYSWSVSGTYYDTLINHLGCDSIIRFNLTLNHSSSDSVSVIACDSCSIPGGHYVWTNSGLYADTIINVGGCDSVISVDLTIRYSSTFAYDTTACNFISPSGNHSWNLSGLYYDTIPNTSGCDSILVIQLASNDTAVPQTITACDSIVSPSGNFVYTTSGIYHDTIPTAGGCDSLITIYATVNHVDTSVSFNFPVLTANTFGASYQWIDCDNGAFIPGANGRSYSVTSDGSYAVIIIENGCFDTSSCYSVSITGIHQIKSRAYFYVHPSPVNRELQICMNKEVAPINGNTKMEMSILNIFGQSFLRLSQTVEIFPFTLDVSELPPDIYFLQLRDGSHSYHIKFIKE